MNARAPYAPAAAFGVAVEKTGENWTLVLTRELKHPPEKVWAAITDPAQLREWSPFDASGSLATAGANAKLTTVGAPQLHVTETKVTRAEPPRLLQYNWGGFDMRWELRPNAGGTRLTLWTNINRKYMAMGATGWHICFDVLDRYLSGHPIGRIVGPAAMKVDGWQRLLGEYTKVIDKETA